MRITAKQKSNPAAMLAKFISRVVITTFFCMLTSAATAQEKPRILVLTDISNEPDDEESLVRFLVYAN